MDTEILLIKIERIQKYYFLRDTEILLIKREQIKKY